MQNRFYRFLETRDGRHIEASNNSHQGIEIPDVEALSSYFDPIFNHFDPLLLLRILWNFILVKIFSFLFSINKGIWKYRANLRGDEIAEPIEPLNVRFQITRLLHIFKWRFNIRILFSKSLNKFFRPDKREPLQLDVSQLLGQSQWAGTHLRHVSL